MKKITKNTILKQGDKTYQPVESDGIIYWVDKPLDKDGCIVPKSIVALTKPKFTDKPIISLDSYVERLALNNAKNNILSHKEQDINTEIWISGARQRGFIEGYKSNPNKWTDEEIEKAIELAINGRRIEKSKSGIEYLFALSKEEILHQISEILEIEVNSEFNIVNYK
jgi:hypothetical protein